MSKLCKLISLTMALVMLMAMASISAYAAGNYKTFATFNETYTFDEETTLGSGDETIFIANTDADDTISIGKDGDNSFLQVSATNGYPWFATYMGSGATAEDVVVKFDYYVNSTSGKDRISLHYANGTSKNVVWFDYAQLKVLDKTIMTIKKDTWYNFELHTDKEVDSAMYRIKEATADTWTEGWVTVDGYFSGVLNSNLSQIRFAVQKNNTYTSCYDNYSHSQENVEDAPRPKLYKAFDRYAETATFSESEDINHYVFIANAQTPTLAVDPENAENKVLNIYDAEKKSPWVGPYAEATGSSDTLQMTFDFYDANGNNAFEFVKLLLANNSQPFAVQFKNGKLLAGIDEMPIYDDNGEVLSYDANKWYTITIKMNWQTNYLQIGFKEKGAADYRWSTNPFYADFVRITSDNVNLSQIRIGYSRVFTNDVSFYIDNYSHTTAEDAVAATSDVTMAMLPKAITTKVDGVDVITGVESYAMTLSGEEKTVTLLVALYDELGRITDVKLSEVTCSDAIGTPVTVDLTGETFASWRGFVIGAMEDLCPLDIVESARW